MSPNVLSIQVFLISQLEILLFFAANLEANNALGESKCLCGARSNFGYNGRLSR